MPYLQTSSIQKISDSLVDSVKLHVNKLVCWFLCWRENAPSSHRALVFTHFQQIIVYLGTDGPTISISIEKGYSEINPLKTEKLCRPVLIHFLPHRKQYHCLL